MTETMIHIAAFMGAVGQAGATLVNVTERLPLDERSVATLAGRCIALDLVDRDGEGLLTLTARGLQLLVEGVPHIRTSLASATGARRPVANTLRQRAWTGMRLAQRFTVGSLLILAKQPDDSHPESNIRRYIRGLVAAGYVALLPSTGPAPIRGGTGYHQYRLMRDTGPLCPVLRRGNSTIFDPNIGGHTRMERNGMGVRDVA